MSFLVAGFFRGNQTTSFVFSRVGGVSTISGSLKGAAGAFLPSAFFKPPIYKTPNGRGRLWGMYSLQTAVGVRLLLRWEYITGLPLLFKRIYNTIQRRLRLYALHIRSFLYGLPFSGGIFTRDACFIPMQIKLHSARVAY